MNQIQDTEKLFFELIRVAIGTQDTLTRAPSVQEWKKLYDMAKKQSLVGVCFAAVQRLPEDMRPSEMLYLTWMGMAAKIQQRNEVVNRQCVELQVKLTADGFDGCVIKGQSYAALYGDLALLRQSGDIDFWVNADMRSVLKYSKANFDITEIDYHHVEVCVFDDTPVELHYIPSISRNLLRNIRLQRIFKKNMSFLRVADYSLCFKSPNSTVNIVIAMNHAFWHLMYEGVGLRQMMDLFFVLKKNDLDEKTIQTILDDLNLHKFTSACMWLLIHVFGMEEKYCLCEPNESAGKFLLNEVINAGNFGKHDRRIDHSIKTSRPAIFFKWMKCSFMKFSQYPIEVLWAPIGIIYISLMSKIRRKI